MSVPRKILEDFRTKVNELAVEGAPYFINAKEGKKLDESYVGVEASGISVASAQRCSTPNDLNAFA